MSVESVGSFLIHVGVRDAIHCPIISVAAVSTIQPGQPIKITGDGNANCASWMDAVGIADPFLRRNIVSGEKFWAWIRPGSISSLTHAWTHRQIPDMQPSGSEKEAARIRLKEFAEKELGVTLERMLETIMDISSGHGEMLYSHSYESLSEYDGFWNDYTFYTGRPDPNSSPDFYGFYTCGGCS